MIVFLSFLLIYIYIRVYIVATKPMAISYRFRPFKYIMMYRLILLVAIFMIGLLVILFWIIDVPVLFFILIISFVMCFVGMIIVQQMETDYHQNMIRNKFNKKLNTKGKEKYTAAYELIRSASSNENMRKIAQEQIEYVDGKLCDETNMQEKFNLLRFSDWSIEVQESGTIDVTGKVEVIKDIELSGKKAILDGTLKIDVLNGYQDVVGSCYYFAPGYGVTALELVGFEHVTSISVQCPKKGTMPIISKDVLTCKVSPVNMWTIEC